jgi:type II secretory ATPase GspE/PulE/Tfp pilus assembly ATPase PilB-like protein
MGGEPYLIASSIRGILAQTLVRKRCNNCREEYEMESSLLNRLGIKIKEKTLKLSRGCGCKLCFETGYQGRMAIGELILVSENIRRLIVEKAPSTLIKQQAITEGMIPLRDDGLKNVLEGKTAIEEVLRVTEIE